MRIHGPQDGAPARTPRTCRCKLGESFTIGDLRLGARWVLAPMAGVTDWPFRILARAQGAALAYTEMVSSEGLVRGGAATSSLLDSRPDDQPFAPQIFGADPVRMARAARIVESMGAALVDLNMGCPVKKVCRSGAGAALLRDPQRIKAIVSAVVDRVSIPVQVKTRIGWDESSVNVVELAGLIEEAGASAIVVHGRTRAQGYSGFADWDVIAAVGRSASKMKVIGNGDITTAGDALAKLERHGVDAVMIGRGALGHPWIFRDIAALARGEELPLPPSYEEWRATIGCHLRDLVTCLGGNQERAVRKLRKHLVWYTRGLRGAQAFRAELSKVKSAEDVERSLDRHFPRGEDPLPQGDGKVARTVVLPTDTPRTCPRRGKQ